MGGNRRILSTSFEETVNHGKLFGKLLEPNSIVCLQGDLAAGKTAFVKGVVNAIAGTEPEEVISPTFSYLNIYGEELKVYHFDLYRLADEEEFLALGFDEFFDSGGIVCIEWSERIQSILPDNCYTVSLFHSGPFKRKIEICGFKA